MFNTCMTSLCTTKIAHNHIAFMNFTMPELKVNIYDFILRMNTQVVKSCDE